MDEIAEPAPHAAFPAVEPTARFPEVGDGGELAVDRAGGVPAAIERVAGLLRRILVLETGIDIAYQIYRSFTSATFSQVIPPPSLP